MIERSRSYEQLSPEGLTFKQQVWLNEVIKTGLISYGDSLSPKSTKGEIGSPKSGIYLNLRDIKGKVSLLRNSIDVMSELLRPFFPTTAHEDEQPILCDVPMGITPVASGLSLELYRPLITARMKGGKVQFDGLIEENKKKPLIVLEDVMSTVGSIVEVLNLLKESGSPVRLIATMVDRQHGGAERLTSLGYQVVSAVNLDQVLKYSLRTKAITFERYIDVQDKLMVYNEYLRRNRI